MSRDRIGAALAVARRAALASAPRAHRLYAEARRRPDTLLAAALLLGVLLMVLHWKGSPIEPSPPRAEPAMPQAVAGP